MKYVWTFRRVSFDFCPTRGGHGSPHEAVQEFVIQGKDFIESAVPLFQDHCRFCKLAMPSEGKWQVSTEEA